MPEDTAIAPRLARRTLLTAAGAAAAATVTAADALASRPPAATAPTAAEAPTAITLTLRPDGTADPVPLPLEETTTSTATVETTTGHVTIGTTAHATELRTATVRPGDDAWLRARRAGSPGVPADRLVITAAGGHRREIDVWVEPEGGTWAGADGARTPLELGIVAIHASLLRASPAEVLMVSLARERDPFTGEPLPADGPRSWNIYRMDDMEARALRLPDRTLADRRMAHPKNIFCSGQAQFPDGRLVHVGGHITKDDAVNNAAMIHVYDPREPDADRAWTALDAHLDPARWYPTVTALPDGLMLITSGATTLPKQNSADLEPTGYWNAVQNSHLVLDPTTGTLTPGGTPLIDQTRIDAVNDAIRADHADLSDTEVRRFYQQLSTYPHVSVLPGDAATVVALVESNRAWLYRYDQGTLTRTDAMYRMLSEGSRCYPHYGAMVLLPLGDGRRPRILAVGGQHEDTAEHRRLGSPAANPATDTAEILEIDTDTVTAHWTGAGRMARPRVLCDATLLADGTVLVSGGSERGWGDINDTPVHEAELFDPTDPDRRFRPAGVAATARRYHSTALLLPDGTVMKAGSTGGFGSYVDGTADRMVADTTAEFYYPGYLFRGPRPVLAETPNDPLRHGETLDFAAAGPAVNERARAALIKPGSTTHGNNMDQRYVWLDTALEAAGGSWRGTAALPDAATAPPGNYMLVLVAENGVPSEAAWVTLTVPG